MRILQICSVRDFGGGERHVADLANSLVRRGHDVFAVANTAARLTLELHSLRQENIFQLRIRGAGDLIAAENIADVVRENDIDIIHAHAARDYPLAAIASQRSGAPFVLTRHVLFPMKRLHRLLLRKAARVIAVSNAVAGVLRKQNIFQPEKIVTIHNGIDTSRFSATRRRHRKGPLRIGTVGHVSPIKGQEDLIRAAEIVVKQRRDVEFLIAGEDKSPRRENEAGLRSMIRELDLENSVHLLGWKRDIADFLSGLDLFISAARSEPFGLVMLEAMAAGLPILATRSEGALEILDDGITGVFAPLADPTGLAIGLMKLIDDPSLCERMAINARAKVDESFSLNGMVDATEKVYADMLLAG